MGRINISKVLYNGIVISLAAFGVTAVCAQLLLIIPSVGGALPVSGVAEYERIESPAGQILIELKEGYKPDNNIKILVNGQESADLASDSVSLTVMNNSVVEIDGRRASYPFEVGVAPVNDSTVCDGEYAAVDGNLVRLTRVFVNVDNQGN